MMNVCQQEPMDKRTQDVNDIMYVTNEQLQFFQEMSFNPQFLNYMSGIPLRTITDFIHVERDRIIDIIYGKVPNNFKFTNQSLNVSWFNNILLGFLERLKFFVYYVKTNDKQKSQIRLLLHFMYNWSQLLDDETLRGEKYKLQDMINQISEIIDNFYSFVDIIYLMREQSENLKKWNSFRPAGLDIAPHMLDILYQKLENGEQPDLLLQQKTEEMLKQTEQ